MTVLGTHPLCAISPKKSIIIAAKNPAIIQILLLDKHSGNSNWNKSFKSIYLPMTNITFEIPRTTTLQNQNFTHVQNVNKKANSGISCQNHTNKGEIDTFLCI